MRWSVNKPLSPQFAWLALALGLVCAGPAPAQNLENMVSSEARVFPQASGGIIAMKEDAGGNFYVLANPGHTVQLFDAAGKPTGAIPNGASGDVTLHYAVDFDLTKTGDLIVADRGANAVYVFAADGTLKSRVGIFAPTSIVSLSNGQFAVTTLKPEHPVEVIDQQGHVVRGFGEPHHQTDGYEEGPPAALPLADTGRIVGDSADNLYFAILSSDRLIRKYDRFGYAAYAAAVPPPVSDIIANGPGDRFQVTFNFNRLTHSDQINSWATLGESGKIDFGSNVGVGLAGLMGASGRGGRGGQGGGAVAGTLSGETSLSNYEFNLHVGMAANGRGGRGGQTGGGSGRSTGLGGGNAALQYNSNSSSSSDLTTSDPALTNALQYEASNNSNGDVSGAFAGNGSFPGTLDYMVGNPQGDGFGPRGGVGGFSSFFLGGLGPRPGAFGRGFDSQMTNGLKAGDTFATSGAAGAAHAGMGGPEFGGRGHFGGSVYNFAGGLRINLDRPKTIAVTEKTITAVGVDHQTQEIWAAIGPMVVHFDRDGNLLDTYYLTTPEGALLQTTAIVVEPGRLLVGSSAGGVYEFARPDKKPARGSQVVAAPAKAPTR